MKKGLSVYKIKKIAEQSLRNALRLHSDSILLFNNCSYPSAFQLSVLALEEIAKAKWLDDYYYTSITNEGFLTPDDEQAFLKLLYIHPEKQFAFIGRDIFDYSPKFVNHIKSKQLEFKKQQSVYVGLDRIKGQIDTNSRISVPVIKIKEIDAKKVISLVNDEFINSYNSIQKFESYFGINELDSIIDPVEHSYIFSWQHRSGLKSKKWAKVHHENGS